MYSKYKKYPNVYTGKQFAPIVGDFRTFIDSAKDGKIFYYNLREELSRAKGCDLALLVYGINPEFKLLSPQAIKEYKDLYLTKIDRSINKTGLGKMSPKGFSKMKTNENFLERKKNYLRLLSLNSSSKFIPDMLSRTKNRVNTFEVGKKYNSFDELNKITLDIFIVILLGNDVELIAEKKKTFTKSDDTT